MTSTVTVTITARTTLRFRFGLWLGLRLIRLANLMLRLAQSKPVTVSIGEPHSN